MAQNNLGTIIIIANARWRGGLSGGDNIYLNFARYWGECEVWDMMDTDFKPFWLCYLYRIWAGCVHALRTQRRYAFVYSASDFLMDSIPALILKLKGNKWAAGYYMHAPKKMSLYWILQQVVRFYTNRWADVTLVTNESMFKDSPGRKFIAVHGGVNLEEI